MQLKREKYESLVANVNWLKQGLKGSREKLMSSITDIDKKMEMCLEMIQKKKREEITKILKILNDGFDQMKHTVDMKRQETIKFMKEQIQMIDTHLSLSEDILQNTDPKVSTHEDIQNNGDIIESLSSEIEGTLSMNETYEYFSYSENKDVKTAEKLCGKLVPKETSSTLWNRTKRIPSTTSTPVSSSHRCSDPCIAGTREISTEFKYRYIG